MNLSRHPSPQSVLAAADVSPRTSPRKSRKLLPALALASAIAGCTVGPNYQQPGTRVPDQFVGAVTTQPTTAASTTQPSLEVVTGAWWTTFDDPVLTRVVERAAKSNLDLRAAEARVREARALRQQAASDYYPTVDASGSYSRSRASRNVSFGADGAGSGAGGASASEQDLFTAGFDAAWELDVFGGVRRSVEAANAEIQSAIADRNDVLLTLLGEVARNYVELRGFQRQVAIAEDNVRAQRETLELTRARLNAGLTSDLDVARSEAQVASTASAIPSFQAAVQQAIHRLSVLTGLEPNALMSELGPAAPIPAPPPSVPVGLPSELLRRRPDVRRAERNLASATARVGVATADLFPRFTLNGSLGLQSDKLTNLPNTGSTFWSIGPGVTVPIFNSGRLRAGVRAEQARTEQFAATYEQTVLNALADVESALVSYQKEYARRDALAQAVEANGRAVRLSTQLYQRGLTDFLDVLDAQRALFLVQDELARSDTTVSSNAVALFKALGGGWDAERLAAGE